MPCAPSAVWRTARPFTLSARCAQHWTPAARSCLESSWTMSRYARACRQWLGQRTPRPYVPTWASPDPTEREADPTQPVLGRSTTAPSIDRIRICRRGRGRVAVNGPAGAGHHSAPGGLERMPHRAGCRCRCRRTPDVPARRRTGLGKTAQALLTARQRTPTRCSSSRLPR